MFDRFTERARKVIILAKEEAKRFNHDYIGTEHILLGLIKEGESVAAAVLQNLGLSLDTIRLEVEKLVQFGPSTVVSGDIPFTPKAKKVIELAMDEARRLGHNYIGTEHLLLGLIKEGQHYTPERIHRLALEPGFSTQDQANQISGRGVGMDVVRAEVEGLGGEIHLSSEAKRGSLVRLAIPLSRAVLSCLRVRCDRQVFGIPLGNVHRVQAGREILRGGDQLEVLGKSLPLESLQACLGLPEPEAQRAFVVLTQQGGSAESVEVAIGVDEVLGRGEVLLRSLPELARIPGIMGGSPQEEGILWVLDPEAILGLAMDSLMRRVARV